MNDHDITEKSSGFHPTTDEDYRWRKNLVTTAEKKLVKQLTSSGAVTFERIR